MFSLVNNIPASFWTGSSATDYLQYDGFGNGSTNNSDGGWAMYDHWSNSYGSYLASAVWNSTYFFGSSQGFGSFTGAAFGSDNAGGRNSGSGEWYGYEWGLHVNGDVYYESFYSVFNESGVTSYDISGETARNYNDYFEGGQSSESHIDYGGLDNEHGVVNENSFFQSYYIEDGGSDTSTFHNEDYFSTSGEGSGTFWITSPLTVGGLAPLYCNQFTAVSTSSLQGYSTSVDTDTYRITIGSTTYNAISHITDYTTVTTLINTTTWHMFTVPVSFTIQVPTFTNYFGWGIYDQETILIAQVDILHDDWCWVVDPMPAHGATGRFTDFAHSFDTTWVQPRVITPIVDVYTAIDGDTDTSNTVNVYNPVVSYNSITNVSTTIDQTATPAIDIAVYNTGSLPMEIEVDQSYYQVLATSTWVSIDSYLSNTEGGGCPKILTTYNVTINDAVYPPHVMFWSGTDGVNSAIYSENVRYTTGPKTIGVGSGFHLPIYSTYQSSYDSTVSNDSNGNSFDEIGFTNQGYVGLTYTLADIPIGFDFSGAFDTVFNGIFRYLVPEPRFKIYTNVFQLPGGMDTGDNSYQGIGAAYAMPYIMPYDDPKFAYKTFGPDGDNKPLYMDSVHVRDARTPFMYNFQGGWAAPNGSGWNSFVDDNGLEWSFIWATNGDPVMSVTSASWDYNGTQRTLIESGSFINTLFPLGDAQTTITREFNIGSLPFPQQLLYTQGRPYGGVQFASSRAVTVVLAGAFTVTEMSDDVNFLTTAYSSATPVTIPSSVISVLTSCPVWVVSTYTFGPKYRAYGFFSKHATSNLGFFL